MAANNGHTAVVQALLQGGADVGATDKVMSAGKRGREGERKGVGGRYRRGPGEAAWLGFSDRYLGSTARYLGINNGILGISNRYLGISNRYLGIRNRHLRITDRTFVI